MVTLKEITDQFDDFKEWVVTMVDNDGRCGDIYKRDNGKYMYNPDNFHLGEKGDMPLSEVKCEAIINDISDDFLVLYSNDMPYFSDYADIPLEEYEDALVNEFKKLYSDDIIKDYENDACWLLDDLAFKKVFPDVFEMLKNGTERTILDKYKVKPEEER